MKKKRLKRAIKSLERRVASLEDRRRLADKPSTYHYVATFQNTDPGSSTVARKIYRTNG